MPNPYLRSKIEERASQSEVLKSLQTRASDDKRDLTDAERKTFDEIVARLEQLDEEIKRISDFDSSASRFLELVGAQKQAEESADRAHDKAGQEPAEEDSTSDRKALATRASFGRRFVESTEFRTYKGSGSSGRVSLPGPASAEFRAAISLGDFDELAKQWWVGPGGYKSSTPLLDLIGRVATSQSAVLYLSWGTIDPPAVVVPEGGLKPEAVLAPTTETVALETYAHYKGITRQALEDIPQVQSIVQNKLLNGVRNALEAAAAAAINGADFPDASGPDMLSGIRNGIAVVEAAGYSPNGVLVNPADAAGLDLAAMGASFGGPSRSNGVWGLPIVAANAVPAGTSYVGDFNQGVTWFDRGVTDVFMSDSHADFFLRNTLVILAEARAAFAVTELNALAEVTVVPPVVGATQSAPASKS